MSYSESCFSLHVRKVGKTWLAKTLAAQYYGSEKDMVRIDMSE